MHFMTILNDAGAAWRTGQRAHFKATDSKSDN